jgi:hypothetical protein
LIVDFRGVKTMYEVAEYQGNVYCRYVGENDTTVYMDTVLGVFDIDVEAARFMEEVEDAVWEEYERIFY